MSIQKESNISILEELNALLKPILPVETGVFSDVPPSEYIVLTPMTEDFALYGDDIPLIDVSEVRISLFSKGSYTKRKNQIMKILLTAEFTITQRRYIGYEGDTGYHHYCLDCAKPCFL